MQGLAFQIKALRQAKGLTQGQLAKALELGSQSAVARLEDPSYGRMSLSTLLKVGEFFDVALLTKFVSYSRLLCEQVDLSPAAMNVSSFEHEDAMGAIENAPEFRLLMNINPPSTAPAILSGRPVSVKLTSSSSTLSPIHMVTASNTLVSYIEVLNG